MIKFITIIFVLIVKITTAYAQESNTISLSKLVILKDLSYTNAHVKLTGKICHNCDAIVDINGPKSHYKIWKKEKRPPFWLKSKEFIINNAKSYYYLISTNSLRHMVSPEIIKSFDINKLCSGKNNNCSNNEFVDFYKKDLIKNKLLQIKEKQLIVDQDGRFELQILLPSGALNGTYLVRFFVFKGLELISSQQLEFKVKNNQFYSALNQFALTKPKLYILFSICIALIFGYLAAFLFRKGK